MGLNLEQKKAVVAEVSAKVAQAQAIVLAEYRGLEVGDMTELRAKARQSGVYFRVLKNTLARRAVADTPFAGLAEQMFGPLAYGISTDPVAVAKVLHEFCEGQREVRHQGRRDAERGDVSQGRRRARQPAQPRGTARQAAGHHAGADREVRPDAERGAARFVRTLAAVRDQKEQSRHDERSGPRCHPLIHPCRCR